jgi:hypothetical protein
MWHRLNRDDFVRTGGLQMRIGSETRTWEVCEEYEPRQPDEASRYDYLSFELTPKYPPNREDRWRTYHPLEDTPDLFLKFARLYNGGRDRYVDSIFVNSIIEWVHRYGLLGYDKYSYYGGPEETIGNYAGSAYWAAGILAMYEAALNGDEEAAKAAVLEEFLSVDIVGSALERMGEQDFVEQKVEHIEEHWNGSYVEYALTNVKELVTHTIRDKCFPILNPREGVSDPSKLSAGWSFKSLYGAMYLQMYWLMAAGGDVTRCEYCGQIISLARPHPEGRKRRRDKRFCDDACRQAHHRSKKRAKKSSADHAVTTPISTPTHQEQR